MNAQKAIFLDLFGTLIHDHGAMDKIDDIRFKDKSVEALKKFQDHGFIIFLSVCRIDMPIPERSYLKDVQNYVSEKLLLSEIENSSIHFISHVLPQSIELHPITLDAINSLVSEYNLKLSSCVLVGDLMKDIRVGEKAGVKTALLSSPEDSPMEVDDEWVEPDMIGDNLYEIANKLVRD
ncbi:HAD hydrolase-like protein [bacterium]|nr:HAD hydrolase-like protein [bacterium]